MYVLDYGEGNAGEGSNSGDGIAGDGGSDAGRESVSEPPDAIRAVRKEVAKEVAKVQSEQEEERAQQLQQLVEIGDYDAPQADAVLQQPQQPLSTSSQLGSHSNFSVVLDGAAHPQRSSAASAQLIGDVALEVAERQKLAKFLQQERAVDDLVGALCL